MSQDRDYSTVRKKSSNCHCKVHAESPVSAFEAMPEQTFVPCNENLLDRARTQWLFGDWVSLAQLHRDSLQQQTDRAVLALLAAAGRLQIGQTAEAKAYIRLAEEWGVSKKLISQILIAGVHNSLGRAAALAGLQPCARKHFESSISVGAPGGDIRLLAQARTDKQMQQLKLLDQQVKYFDQVKSSDLQCAILGAHATYQVHVKFHLFNSSPIQLGLNAAKKEWIRVLPSVLEYQTENDMPLYLVSNESGNFKDPSLYAQITLKANTAYLISGKLDHEGDNRPIVWIFQYAQGKQIDAQPIDTESGRFQHSFSTKPEMESFAIGLRLLGRGKLNLVETFITLREQTAQEVVAQFEAKIETLKQAQKREMENSMKQIESTIRLQHYLGPGIILPDTHKWQISPDFGVFLVNLIEQHGYQGIIEFGSGTSTLIAARALQRIAQREGKSPSPLLSFDHLKEYRDKTQRLINQADLAAHTRIVLAPLVEWVDEAGDQFVYYACDEALRAFQKQLPHKEARVLVIVDGPPAVTCKHARYPALPKVLEILGRNHHIDFLLDDYIRSEERQVATRWVKMLEKMDLTYLLTEFKALEKKACLIEISPVNDQ